MNCWKVLKLSPGVDLDALKARRRELIRKYHPDLAQTPERRRRFTIKAAEINVAYDDAVKQVRASGHASGVIRTSASASTPHSAITPVATWLWKAAAACGVILLIAFGQIALKSGVESTVEWVGSLGNSNPLRVGAFLFVSVAGGLLMGLLLTVVPDLIAFRVVSAALPRGVKRYSDKIGFLAVVTLNTFIFSWLSGAHAYSTPRSGVYFAISRVVAAYWVPSMVVWWWLREMVAYRRLGGTEIQRS